MPQSQEARGAALGRDGTLYVATADGSAPLSNALIALEAGSLKLKSSATVAGAGFTSSPVVFTSGDRDVVAVAGKGKLYLFDSAALASWVDDKNTRWIAVPSAPSTFRVRTARCTRSGLP